PKTRDGIVEAIRVLRVARRGAVKARTAALNALTQTVICAPEPLRARLAGLRGAKLVNACAALRPTRDRRGPTGEGRPSWPTRFRPPSSPCGDSPNAAVTST